MHADRHTSRWVYTMFWTLTSGVLRMSKFKEIFRQDMARYDNKPELFIKLLTYFLRKSQTTNNSVLGLVYRVFFRLIASSRGLEISPMTQIGGGYILAMHII